MSVVNNKNDNTQTTLFAESIKLIYLALYQYRTHVDLFKAQNQDKIIEHADEIGELLFLLRR